MPHVSPISFRDCVRLGWRVLAHCDGCRATTQADAARIAEGAAATRPIRALFDARKLTCRKCGKPLAGVSVSIDGASPLERVEVVSYWREGSMYDPAVAAYWEGYRKGKAGA